MAHCFNTNSLKVFGQAFVPTFRAPAKYTGELLGVYYLLSQTGQPLVVNPDSRGDREHAGGCGRRRRGLRGRRDT
ncbi:unnamed protein product [Leuciscus chuanchicus]